MNFGPLEYARLAPQKLSELTNHLDRLIAGRLWAKILLALLLGFVVGIALGPEVGWISAKTSKSIADWLSLPAQIFLGLIQLVVIPLVFVSVVLGIVAGENLRQLRSLGIASVIYYIFTTAVSVSIGFVVASIIQPGNFLDKKLISILIDPSQVEVSSVPKMNFGLTQIIPSLLPQNPLGAIMSGEMLQIVLLAVFLGVALMSLKSEDAKPLVDLLRSFQKVSMIVIGWAMMLAPVAVFCLIAQLISQIGFKAMTGLLVYMCTVVLGLLLVLVFYGILVKVIAQKNPFTFFSKLKEVQLLAFSTSSSAAVMPLTMETAEKKLKIPSSVSQFIIPLGTTINMDGTALYQGVATLFLAQVFDVQLTTSQLGLVVITAIVSSVGAPGAPGVGIAILSMILTSVGIPASGVMLIVGVDRILDMCRTVINVSGDLTAAQVMAKFLSWKKKE